MGLASHPKLGLIVAISLLSTLILGSPLYTTTSLGDAESQLGDIDAFYLYQITFYGASIPGQTFGLAHSGVNHTDIPFKTNVDHIHTSAGPCHFQGTSGLFFNIAGEHGGDITIGPPQMIVSIVCGLTKEESVTAPVTNLDLQTITQIAPLIRDIKERETTEVEPFELTTTVHLEQVAGPAVDIRFFGSSGEFVGSGNYTSGEYLENPCAANDIARCIPFEVSYITTNLGPCNFLGEFGTWYHINSEAGGDVAIGPPQQINWFFCGYDNHLPNGARDEAHHVLPGFVERDPEESTTKEPVHPGWVAIWLFGADNSQTPLSGLYPDDGTTWLNPCFNNSVGGTCIKLEISLIVASTGPCLIKGESGIWFEIPTGPNEILVSPPQQIVEFYCGYDTNTRVEAFNFTQRDIEKTKTATVWFDKTEEYKVSLNCDVWNNPTGTPSQISSNTGPCWFQGQTTGDWYTIPDARGGTVDITPAESIYDMYCGPCDSTKRKRDGIAVIQMLPVGDPPVEYKLPTNGRITYGSCNAADGCKPYMITQITSTLGPCYFRGQGRHWFVILDNDGVVEVSPAQSVSEMYCTVPKSSKRQLLLDPTTTKKDLVPTPRQASPTAYITFVHADNTGLAFTLIADGALTAPLCPAGDTGCGSQSVYKIESTYGPCLFQGKTTGTWYNIGHFTTEPAGGTVTIGTPQPIYQMCCNCAVNGAPGHDELIPSPTHAKKWLFDTAPQFPTVDINLFQYGPPDPTSKSFRKISKLFELGVPASMDSGRTLTTPDSSSSSANAIDYISTSSGPCYFETESGARIDIADDGWNDVHVAPPQVIRFAACGLSENFSTLKRDELDRNVSVTLYSAADVAETNEFAMNEGPFELESELEIDHVRTSAGPCFLHDMYDNVVAEIDNTDGGEATISPPQMISAVWCGGI